MHAPVRYVYAAPCYIIIYSNHGHRFSCSVVLELSNVVMLELGCTAPIAIKWPAAVLVIWPNFNVNAQRRPRRASLGLAGRCFLRGYGGFYSQALALGVLCIQEDNQIGRLFNIKLPCVVGSIGMSREICAFRTIARTKPPKEEKGT